MRRMENLNTVPLMAAGPKVIGLDRFYVQLVFEIEFSLGQFHLLCM
jgi:hypothetical protein